MTVGLRSPGRNERSRRECAGFSVMRRRAGYLRREDFFAAFLRAPPFFAPDFAPFFADDLRADFFAPFFRAAMVISDEGVERSIEPPVVRTSQWMDAEASSPPRRRLMASQRRRCVPSLHGDARGAEVHGSHLVEVQQ
jgi:hypothetical protein